MWGTGEGCGGIGGGEVRGKGGAGLLTQGMGASCSPQNIMVREDLQRGVGLLLSAHKHPYT